MKEKWILFLKGGNLGKLDCLEMLDSQEREVNICFYFILFCFISFYFIFTFLAIPPHMDSWARDQIQAAVAAYATAVAMLDPFNPLC